MNLPHATRRGQHLVYYISFFINEDRENATSDLGFGHDATMYWTLWDDGELTSVIVMCMGQVPTHVTEQAKVTKVWWWVK